MKHSQTSVTEVVEDRFLLNFKLTDFNKATKPSKEVLFRSVHKNPIPVTKLLNCPRKFGTILLEKVA